MTRRILLLAAALAALGGPVAAQSLSIAGIEIAVTQNRGERGERDGGRVSFGEVLRRLQASRPGSMRNVTESSQGGRPVYIVMWEYPGGRIAYITVDQRSGQVIGEN